MTYKGIDCATKLNDTSAKGLKDAGVTHVGRYLGHSWKGLTLKEVNDISSAGLKIFSIFEMSPTHTSYFTTEQGIKDAQDAMTYAKEILQPEGTAIYFTVDYGGGNNDLPEIEEYFKAVKDNLKSYKIGGYGSYKVVDDLKDKGLINYVFQTYAWSSKQVEESNDIYQYLNGQNIAGIQVDLDKIMDDDVGAWSLTIEQDAEVISKPKLKPQPKVDIIKLGDKGDKVLDIQKKLKALGYYKGSLDKIFGQLTDKAIRDFQKDEHISVDGLVGAITLQHLNKAKPKKQETLRYSVRNDDSLSELAARFDTSIQDIAKDNYIKDVNLIRAGQLLIIHPGEKAHHENKPKYKSYKIKSGDSFWSIESDLNIPHGELQRINKNVNPLRLQIGEKINIPN